MLEALGLRADDVHVAPAHEVLYQCVMRTASHNPDSTAKVRHCSRRKVGVASLFIGRRAQALRVVKKAATVPFFGRTTEFIINYTPDHAVHSASSVENEFANYGESLGQYLSICLILLEPIDAVIGSLWLVKAPTADALIGELLVAELFKFLDGEVAAALVRRQTI